jgi:prolyl oligopeptidase
MKFRIQALLALGACVATAPLAQGQAKLGRPAQTLTPPPTAPVRPVVDDYFGTKMTDPYRWMEESRNPVLLDWMKAQADYTRATLDRIPGRAALFERMLALSTALPARVNEVRRLPDEQYFYLKTAANENLAKLYTRRGWEEPERLLLDPETMPSPDGQPISISYFEPSWNGERVAVGLAAGGSENAVLHVYDTRTGQELDAPLDRMRYGGIAWLPDHHSFFYTRMQKLAPGASVTDLQQRKRVYRHVVGTPVESDRPIFGTDVHPTIAVAPTRLPYVRTHPGSRYALAAVTTGVGGGRDYYVAPLETLGQPGIPWRKVCDASDDVTDAALHGDDLFLVTSRNAPRYQVLRTRLSNPDLATATVVVPPGVAVLSGYAAGWGVLAVAQDGLYVQQLDGGLGRLWRVPFDPSEKPGYVPLPFAGTLADISAHPGVPGLTFGMGSWVKTQRPYAYAGGTAFALDFQPPASDDLTDVEVREVRIPSHDGTLVPLSIIHRRGLTLDGSHPTWLHGYGAYGISQTSGSGPLLRAWVERGGVYAVAHVRGGGEYGEEWHRAGFQETKPNTWKDFIACAEYLIREKYTAPRHLGGLGISAGGILIGRAITERPDLFAAAGIAVGLTDMLRYETTANGVPNIAEFGSVKTEAGFRNLLKMSAYHHVQDGTRYPAVLLATGINDPRVDPWLAAKMTARLQAATASGKPVLLRVDYRGGHGPGVTRRQQLETFADGCAFLFWQLGHPDFQPTPPKSLQQP